MALRHRASTAALALLALPAWAHHPFGQCVRQPPDKVQCTGGFDERPVAGLRIDVLDSRDRILIHGRLDARGSFVFRRPEGDFYVLIDPGPGLTVEIDGKDVR